MLVAHSLLLILLLTSTTQQTPPPVAQYPFFILGRVGNISDEEIQKAWDEGKREVLIETVLRESKRQAGRHGKL